MALNMLDEMVRLLREAGVEDGKVTRYKREWAKAEKSWPCPVCYGTLPGTPGRLTLINNGDSLASAVCSKCRGFICDDFIDPTSQPDDTRNSNKH